MEDWCPPVGQLYLVKSITTRSPSLKAISIPLSHLTIRHTEAQSLRICTRRLSDVLRNELRTVGNDLCTLYSEVSHTFRTTLGQLRVTIEWRWLKIDNAVGYKMAGVCRMARVRNKLDCRNSMPHFSSSARTSSRFNDVSIATRTPVTTHIPQECSPDLTSPALIRDGINYSLKRRGLDSHGAEADEPVESWRWQLPIQEKDR